MSSLFFKGFLSSFRFTKKIERKVQRFPIYPYPNRCIACPIINTLRQVVDLLQLINRHQHIIVVQSPQFTLYFTHGVAHSTCLHKCVMTCVLHYAIIQTFHCPKNPLLCLLYPYPASTPSPSNHWSFYCLYWFTFSRMSYNWNHTVCSIFWLASLT